MDKESGSASAGGGFGLGTLLTAIFITLKLTDQIDWSWVWVLSPLWISASLIFVILLIIGGIAGVAVLGSGKR